MKLFRDIRAAWALHKSGVNLSQFAQMFLRGEDGAMQGASLTSAYQQSVWVYACVQALGANVAQINFRFSQGERKGENTIESGALVDLFEHPNDYLDRFQFWELLVAWLALRGRAFVVAINKSGEVIPLGGAKLRRAQIAQLILLNPDRVTKIISGQQLLGWRYMAGFEDPLPTQNFLPEEILNVRFPNPFAIHDGMAPLTLAMLAAQTDYASSQFMKGLMTNNADTGVIVTTDQQPTEEQRTAIMAALKERKRAAGTADRPLFLFGGAKLEKPTLNNVDLQFLENRKFNRQEICAVFGVPQEVLGFTEDANYAVMDGARLNFIENKIIPLCERLECALQPIVRAFGQNLYGWFDADSLPIMQKARQARFASAVTGFGMGVPLEQLNVVFDLGLSPTIPHWKKSYLPFSLQEVGADGSPVLPEVESAEDADSTDEEPTDKILRLLSQSAPSAKSADKPHQCAGSAEYDASIAGSVKLKKSKCSRFFFEQRGRVLSKLEEINKAAERGSVAETSRSNSTPAAADASHTAALHRSIDDLFDLAGENQKLTAALKPLLIADLNFGGAQLWQELGLADFALSPSATLNFLGKRTNTIKNINETTFNALKDSLGDGISAGESFDKLTERVKEIFQDATDRRAETIALTETNTAVNSGRMEGMRAAKVEKKSWLTSHLENTRESHWACEQQGAIGLDELFSNGLSHPGDPSGPPSETINCRCHLIAEAGEKSAPGVSPGTRGETRRDAGGTLLRYEEFLDRGSRDSHPTHQEAKP